MSEQIEQISAAAEEVSASSAQMLKTIDGVIRIVEQYSAATEEMAASTTEASQGVEKISVIAEQNRAAAVDVSISTDGMSAESREFFTLAQSLDHMAKGLQNAVPFFGQDDGCILTSRDRCLGKRAGYLSPAIF